MSSGEALAATRCSAITSDLIRRASAAPHHHRHLVSPLLLTFAGTQYADRSSGEHDPLIRRAGEPGRRAPLAHPDGARRRAAGQSGRGTSAVDLLSRYPWRRRVGPERLGARIGVGPLSGLDLGARPGRESVFGDDLVVEGDWGTTADPARVVVPGLPAAGGQPAGGAERRGPLAVLRGHEGRLSDTGPATSPVAVP